MEKSIVTWNLDILSSNGNVSVLDAAVQSGDNYVYTEKAMDHASAMGHCEVLDWWLHSGLPLKYSTDAMLLVTNTRRLEVLNWWLNSGLKLMYTNAPLINASHFAHMGTLEWWINSGLIKEFNLDSIVNFADPEIIAWWFSKKDQVKLVYTERSFDSLTFNEGRLITLFNLWMESGLPLRYTEKTFLNMADKNYNKYFSLWIESGIRIKYTEKLVDIICRAGNLEMLETFYHSGLPFIYTEDAIDRASANCHLNILNWWVEKGFLMKYSEKAINYATRSSVLDWWLDSGLPMKFSQIAFDTAVVQRNYDVLDWWLRQRDLGLDLKYRPGQLDNFWNIKMLDWWVNSGLEFTYSVDGIISLSRHKESILLAWWLKFDPELFEDPKFIEYRNRIFLKFDESKSEARDKWLKEYAGSI